MKTPRAFETVFLTRWPFLLGSFSVLTFVVANVVGLHQAATIDHLAAQISSGTRSVERLSAVRVSTRSLLSAQILALSSRLEGGSNPIPPFDDVRLEGELANLHGSDQEPETEALVAALDMSTKEAAELLRRVHDLLADGKLLEAQRVMRHQARGAIDRSDAAAERFGIYEMDRIGALSRAVMQARTRMSIIDAVLNGLAALLVVLVMLVASRAMRAYARLAQQREALAEERNRELGDFAGRVAHDLRGPLSAMQLRLQYAERTQADPKTFAPPLLRQVRTMTRLVEDLLDFAMSGARPRDAANVSLSTVVEDVLMAVEPEREAARCELSVDDVPDAMVACSRGALTSVLSNLLRNALKFVVEGRPERHVHLRLRRAGESLELEVEDTGPGIPEAKQQAIFEPFVRLEASKHLPGAGLGLATVRRIVEAYGGKIAVRSKEGVGSTFLVGLPLVAEVNEPAKRAVSAA